MKRAGGSIKVLNANKTTNGTVKLFKGPLNLFIKQPGMTCNFP